MFTNLRWKLKYKIQTLLRWLGRPRTAEKAVAQVQEAMEQLGIRIADASIYPKTEEGKKVGSVIMIVGYIPNMACIFKVQLNYGSYDDYTFTIQGQLSEGSWSRVIIGGKVFGALRRNPVGSESDGGHTFRINTYTSYSKGVNATQSARKVAYGMDFFKRFLDEYGHLMMDRFTETLHLWFVPEYSDELKALEAENGEYNNKNYVGFNTRVMSTFPEGFFCARQKP